ncbi:uncharacterized protein BDV17DRAFT_27030 [Aspergillus undulatus]|uniref:uncharacterized protein n=1 Tax=Aspergillus undulatus TaxID=1810928 RepID=UPI003CCDF347
MEDQPSSSRRTSAMEISSSPPQRRRPSTTQAGPSGPRKRRRLTSTSQLETEPIESIDLTEVDGNSAIAKVLAKQREDAIAAQHLNEGENARSRLTAYKCPVCMEPPVDATTTVCGHLFCHKCIIDTLKFSEEQRTDQTGKALRGTCPVCRKPLARADTPGPKRNLVPLQVQLITRKRIESERRNPS